MSNQYYIDPTNGNDGNTGLSNAQAWKTTANATSLAAGSDVAGLCGEMLTDVSLWTINWSGSSGDRVIIGSYYMEGGVETIGVNVDGPFHVRGAHYLSDPGGGGGWDAVISGQGNYQTIQDIKSTWGGIGIELYANYGTGYGLDNCEVLRCTVEDTWRDGIRSVYANTNILIDGNTINRVGRVDVAGYSFDTTSWISSFQGDYITLQNNTCYGSPGEGFLLQDAGVAGLSHVVQDNELCGSLSSTIYFSSVGNGIVRRNFIYGTTNANYQNSSMSSALTFGNEDLSFWSDHCDNISVYNNLVAFRNYGLTLDDAKAHGFSNFLFYHNTIVDCHYRTGIWSNGTQIFLGTCVFKNNVFQRYTAGEMIDNNTGNNDNGALWDYNHWTSAAPATYQGAHDTSGDAMLAKSSGWRTGDGIGTFVATDFKPVTGSPLIDAGTLITGYETDYFGVSRTSGHVAIGAIQPGLGVGTLQSVTPGDGFNLVAFDDGVAGATGYNLYWKAGTGVTKGDNQIVGVTSPYNHTGRTNGQQYSYAYTATNATEESALSNELSGTPNSAPPSSTKVFYFGVK